MNNQRKPIKNFIIFPRKIRDDYLKGELTRNELDILVWIWLNTNPVNGYFSADYKALEREFQNRISYDNIRKIISSLRRKQYTFFLDHKGRKGSFPLYPIGFLLTNGEIQTSDYLTNKLSLTGRSQPKEQPDTKLGNNSESQHHNFKEQKESLIKRFSMGSQNGQITTLYNDNDNKNNNIDNIKISSKRIDVNSFFPKNYEEQKCKEMAKALGEIDMRFLLSCLKKRGFHRLERAWGIFQEIPQERIKNPRKYFNKLIKNLETKREIIGHLKKSEANPKKQVC